MKKTIVLTAQNDEDAIEAAARILSLEQNIKSAELTQKRKFRIVNIPGTANFMKSELVLEEVEYVLEYMPRPWTNVEVLVKATG